MSSSNVTLLREPFRYSFLIQVRGNELQMADGMRYEVETHPEKGRNHRIQVKRRFDYDFRSVLHFPYGLIVSSN